MKVLLTGATGYIGGAFARHALRSGWEIGGLVLPGETIPPDLAAHPGFQAFRGTLQEVPWSAIEAFQPSACIHAAWITTPGVYLESPENYQFLQHSLSFLHHARRVGIQHLVVLGTCIEYAITEERLREDATPIQPTTTYARCKNELRLALEAQAAEDPFTLCWGRVFYPYGPGEHPSRLCSSLIQKLHRDEAIHLKTPHSTKDYIFIEDLAEALWTVTERKYSGTINLGTGDGISVDQIAGTLAELLGKPHLVTHADPLVEDPFGFVVADATRLKGLGWTPRHTLESGLRKLVAALA